MCSITHKTYANCQCRVKKIKVCKEHIEHTRKQIDNEPCPKRESHRIMILNGGCAREQHACVKRRETNWLFEGGSRGLEGL